MNKLSKVLSIIFIYVATSGCGGNPLTELASSDSAEALLEQMKIDADNSDFDSGYTNAQTFMSKYPSRATSDDFIRIYAGILAGQCGYTFASFVSGLGNSSGSNFFLLLRGAFDNTTVVPSKCISAVALMKTLSAPTSNDSLNSLLLNMANIGIILKSASPGTNTCTVSDTATTLSTVKVKNLVASFGTVITNISDITSAISGGVDGLDEIEAMCNPGAGASAEELALASALSPICSADDPSAVTSQTAATFRRLLADSTMGVGSCTLSTDFQILRDPNNDGSTADLVDLGGGGATNYSCCPGLKYNLPTEDALPADIGTDVPLSAGSAD